MLYPVGAFRSLGIVLIAFIIMVELQNDLRANKTGNCKVEAFKVIEFFNKVFNKNPDPEMILDTGEDDIDEDNSRWQDNRLTETPENGNTRRRSSGDNELTLSPWRIFDFGIHGSHYHTSKAVIVKRHAMYNGNKKQWKRSDDNEGYSKGNDQIQRKPDESSDNDNDNESAPMKKPEKFSSSRNKGKRWTDEELERPKHQNRKKMGKKSEDRDGKAPAGKWRKPPSRGEKNKDNDDAEGKSKLNRDKGKNVKASRRGADEEEEEREQQQQQSQEEQEEPQGTNNEKVPSNNNNKQMRKRKPWFWSRRYKAVEDEQPVEESSFQTRLNRRFGDIESWKRMIYCKFNHQAPECAKNETSTNTIDLFGKFRKFTKRPKNKSSTPASNNATSPASNGTTGFTEGSTTEWTRATTSSFDEGKFATNGTTMAIPTRGDVNTVTTAQPTTTVTATTTTGGSTTTTMPPNTQESTTAPTQGPTNAGTTQGPITSVTQTNPTTGQPTTGQPTTTAAPASTTVTTQTVTTLNPTTQPPSQPANLRSVQQDNPSANPNIPNAQRPFTLLP